MAAQISVEGKTEGTTWEFQVRVAEAASETRHRVSVAKSYYEKLTAGKVPPAEFVRQAFEFLLVRESKESILRAFDISVINRYFPEYEGEMQKKFRS